MPNLIRINASATLSHSNSSEVANHYQEKFIEQHPQSNTESLNLIELGLAHLNAEHISAMYSQNLSEKQQALLKQSDDFIHQLQSADTLLIATPMYNFTIPSQLKTYFDLICRVGKTFNYTEQGPQGTLTHLKAVILIASGGDYTQGPYQSLDHVTPYLKTILNFIGITQIEFINAPNMSRDEAAQNASKASALSAIDALF